MKKIYRLILLSIFFVSITFFNSCKKDENPVLPDPKQEFILAENIVQVDSLSFKAALITIDSNLIKFNESNTFAQNLVVGDYLISDYGEGVLRKILSKNNTNNQIILETRQARFDEVILEGSIEYSEYVNFDEMVLADGNYDNVTIQKSKTDLFVSFNDVTISGNSNLKINAGTRITSIKVNCKINFKNGLNSLETFLETVNESYVEVKTSGNVSISSTLPEFGLQYTLGAIPTPILIPLIPKIKFGFGGDIGIQGVSTSRIDGTFTSKVGFGVIGITPYPIFNLTEAFTGTSDLNIEGSQASVFIILPKFGLYAAGLLGPYFEHQLYLEGKVASDNGGKYLALNRGNRGYGGVEFDLFGLLQFGANIDLFDNKKIVLKNYISSGTEPTVATSSITNITSSSATSGGNITAQGSSTVTARGVCWSTSQNPTTADSKSTNGTGTGSFTSSIAGLSVHQHLTM